MAGTTPLIPEVGSSPLLSRKVVDKPIADPMFSNQPQPTPQPQFQQPTQQPSNPQPQEPQPNPQQPFDPQNLPGDASTEHLTPPQNPTYDPNVKSMSFDEQDVFDDDDHSGGSSGSSSSGGGGGGGSSTIEMPKGEAKAFAKLMVQLGSTYVPKILSTFASVKLSELEMLEHEHRVPFGSVLFFQEVNAKAAAGLQITLEEQKMLYDVIKAYLEWKNIEAANPGTALAIALGAVGLRLAITTVTTMGEIRGMYADWLIQNNIGVEVAIEEEVKQPPQPQPQQPQPPINMES